MRLHFLGRAERQHLALVEGEHAVGNARDQAHVVFHHQHRDAEVVLDVLDPEAHFLCFLDVEAGGGLVEQQQLRPHGERTAQLDHLAHAVGQAGHHLVAVMLQIEELDDFLDGAAELQLGAPRRGGEEQVLQPVGVAVAVASDEQVLHHGGVLE